MESTQLMSNDTNPWKPDWTNAVFSLSERDLRWAKVRTIMKREKVDLIVCLPCTNSHDRGAADHRYLTQLGENSDESTVAFPIEGNVTAWHSRGGVWPSSNWFGDIRSARRGSGGATISAWLNENKHYAAGTIAISGLDADAYIHMRTDEGEVNWQSVEILKRNFPKAKFVSATKVLGEARWTKSAEEIEFLRKGTKVAELTLEAVRKHARAGVRERHVFAQMLFANADADGSFTPMFGWASGPLGKPYHRLEQPSFRTLQKGDVLNLEIEGRWGGHIAQIDATAIMGPAPQDLKDAFKLNVEAFERTKEKMKPGVTMRELIAAATISGMNGRAKTGLGLHGRGTGDDGPLLVAARPEPDHVLDMVIAEGCSFALKPSVIVDGSGDYCKWGETVAVTKTETIRLGTRAQEFLVQD